MKRFHRAGAHIVPSPDPDSGSWTPGGRLDVGGEGVGRPGAPGRLLPQSVRGPPETERRRHRPSATRMHGEKHFFCVGQTLFLCVLGNPVVLQRT